jgi:DME family drug/metabolite transporter
VATATESGVVQIVLASVLFGTTGTAQALGPHATTALGVGAVRLAIGGVALVAILPLVGDSRREALALWRSPAAIATGLCTAAYQVCFFAGVRSVGVAIGTLVALGSGPVFAGLLAALLLKERPKRAWIVATVVCLVGLGLLTAGGGGHGHVPIGGLLLVVASGLGYAAYTVGAKRLMSAGHDSSTVMAATFAIGGVVLLPVLLTQPMGWLASGRGLALAFYLGLATITVAYVLFGRGLSKMGAGPVTTLALTEPLVATILGVSVLDERLGVAGIAGALLVLGGVLLQGVVSTRRTPLVEPFAA